MTLEDLIGPAIHRQRSLEQMIGYAARLNDPDGLLAILLGEAYQTNNIGFAIDEARDALKAEQAARVAAHTQETTR